MATTPSAKAPHRHGGLSPLTILLLFPLFVGGILFLPTSVLIIIGMLPTFTCLLIDRDAQRYTSITVGLMNAAGVVPHLVKLWVAGENMSHAIEIISDPLSWLTMYGAATFGWLIYFGVPPFIQAILNQKIKLKIISLDHKQNAMIKEWGDDLRTGIEEPAPPS